MLRKLYYYYLLINLGKKAYKTKKKRAEIYKILLQKIELDIVEGYYKGLCWHIGISINITHNYYPSPPIVNSFPELLAYEPFEYQLTGYWFFLDAEGHRKRVLLLEKAIKLCE